MHWQDDNDDDDDDDDCNDDEDADADLDWVSDVLPGGDKGHADEEDDEGGSVVQLERKVVNRSRIRLPEKSESEFKGILQESES